MLLVPTRSGHRSMEYLGLDWARVVQLVEEADLVQPAGPDLPDDRLCYMSGNYCLFLQPAVQHGEQVLLLTAINRRSRPSPDELAQRRYEARRRKPPSVRRGRGGAGTLLPTTFDELLQRIDNTPGWSYDYGRRNIIVKGPDGQQTSLPKNTSDFRSLANAVSELRSIGLDTRRKAG